MLKEGGKAPESSLPSSEGGEIRLRDLRGKPVVLYFYPRDMTPGCTREAYPRGVVHKVFPRVKVDGHAEEVLAALASL